MKQPNARKSTKPLQVYFLDENKKNGQHFFQKSLGRSLNNYQLHMIEHPDEADEVFNDAMFKLEYPDLFLVSNTAWYDGGEQLVHRIRSYLALCNLPIYCVIYCSRNLLTSSHDCFNSAWKQQQDCETNYEHTSSPFEAFRDPTHPAHLDGTICAENIREELDAITNKLITYWFHG